MPEGLIENIVIHGIIVKPGISKYVNNKQPCISFKQKSSPRWSKTYGDNKIFQHQKSLLLPSLATIVLTCYLIIDIRILSLMTKSKMTKTKMIN